MIADAHSTFAPIPNVDGKTLTKVIEYCKHHVNDVTAVSGAADGKEEGAAQQKKEDSLTAPMSQWDTDFCKLEDSDLFALTLAANFLDIKGLLDICCKTIASYIKGKTPDEIRKRFNIVNDFSK